ncbi:alkaline phosphatase family protein [Pseudonocardia oroxyli]|uniref:Type I phosphodiesterase / nucleotide pyrophosphatase n=1 Tax=Pseudonocardia oroxyli TaxID=366584 RepID=A0A1G7FSB8_PSEOR|nr:nucleotide pyrophosphatase/phosphodiesterase family protein [Pseudonocardia oroxyli]SDE78807.1 Type I phosphodiesterase / nucleotide pyrophosphatase [Pseudonocardia oroxyli]
MYDPAPLLPRYGERSLAEVFPAVLGALGVPGPAPALGLPPVRAAAVLLIDGLGAELLTAHAPDAPTLARLATEPLTVGFPSSTSISVTSLGTGLPPGTHGLVGITFRACEDRLLDSLKWTSHAEAEATDLRDALPPEQIQPHATALERAAADRIRVTNVGPRTFRGSGLTRAALRGGHYQGVHALGDLASEILTALSGPGRRLVYGYHADLDALGHLHGPGSTPWRFQLRQVDRLVATIVEQLPPDSLLLVTGDHGMVQVTRRYDADQRTELRLGVDLLGGDPRARHVYVRPGAVEDVRAAWQETLGEDAWIVTRDEAVAENWFGPVAAHVPDRIGDLVVAMRGAAGVIRSIAEPVMSGLPGQHGSLTAEEQLVPLLLATTVR